MCKEVNKSKFNMMPAIKEGFLFPVFVVLLLYYVDADHESRGTPAQEQCKSSRCATNCSCLHIKPRNCFEIHQNGCDDDGVYRIFPQGYRRGLEVYCDQTTDGGGWHVFQRRFNGTVDFSRNWVDYKYGFGDVTGEFWLGNEHVYNMLKQDHVTATLRVVLTDTENNTMFANYGSFGLSSELSSYMIQVSDFSGNIGYLMRIFTAQVFSTVDRDQSPYHLSSRMDDSGWWFFKNSAVPYGALNGPFAYTPRTVKGEWMGSIKANTYLTKTEMKFR